MESEVSRILSLVGAIYLEQIKQSAALENCITAAHLSELSKELSDALKENKELKERLTRANAELARLQHLLLMIKTGDSNE